MCSKTSRYPTSEKLDTLSYFTAVMNLTKIPNEKLGSKLLATIATTMQMKVFQRGVISERYV